MGDTQYKGRVSPCNGDGDGDGGRYEGRLSTFKVQDSQSSWSPLATLLVDTNELGQVVRYIASVEGRAASKRLPAWHRPAAAPIKTAASVSISIVPVSMTDRSGNTETGRGPRSKVWQNKRLSTLSAETSPQAKPFLPSFLLFFAKITCPCPSVRPRSPIFAHFARVHSRPKDVNGDESPASQHPTNSFIHIHINPLIIGTFSETLPVSTKLLA